ncbi:CYFA0S05e03994g1_1 [Cyberlindnera fabianii]|uniref:NADH dehydrogenase [ubiquinone] 1 beta subcomplex subunit 9 n=1 Tax=Cyberlindnera fabianii TaxID=36022 RepID=A0A061ASY4_CYBFA|nr:NADH dehydrogenase [ubiquinone] 1 beta subcomplex subunit 9 [Cyberlindnera fabianii]CDR40749.1 CYFA0S05e03994g1_1 [Cyberlindnera fabianii]
MSSVVPFSPQNRHVVMTLYRRSLKLAKDWINRRDHYRIKAMEIRAQFDLYKDVGNPKELRALIEKTEDMLAKYKHPDPFISPTRPGGTKFERYVPPSLDKPLPYNY